MQLLFTEQDIAELDAIVSQMPTHWGLQVIRLTNKIADRQQQGEKEAGSQNDPPPNTSVVKNI